MTTGSAPRPTTLVVLDDEGREIADRVIPWMPVSSDPLEVQWLSADARGHDGTATIEAIVRGLRDLSMRRRPGLGYRVILMGSFERRALASKLWRAVAEHPTLQRIFGVDEANRAWAVLRAATLPEHRDEELSHEGLGTLVVPDTARGFHRADDDVLEEAAALVEMLALDASGDFERRLSGLVAEHPAESHVRVLEDGTRLTEEHLRITGAEQRARVLRDGTPDAGTLDETPFLDTWQPWALRSVKPEGAPAAWMLLRARAGARADRVLDELVRATVTSVDVQAIDPERITARLKARLGVALPGLVLSERSTPELRALGRALADGVDQESSLLEACPRGVRRTEEAAQQRLDRLEHANPREVQGVPSAEPPSLDVVHESLIRARDRFARLPPSGRPGWLVAATAFLAALLVGPLWDLGLALTPTSGTHWAAATASQRARILASWSLTMPGVLVSAGAIAGLLAFAWSSWVARQRRTAMLEHLGPLGRIAGSIAEAWHADAGPGPRAYDGVEHAIDEELVRTESRYRTSMRRIHMRAAYADRCLGVLRQRLHTRQAALPALASTEQEPTRLSDAVRPWPSSNVRHVALPSAIPGDGEPTQPAWGSSTGDIPLGRREILDDHLLWEDRFAASVAPIRLPTRQGLPPGPIELPPAIHYPAADERVVTTWLVGQRFQAAVPEGHRHTGLRDDRAWRIETLVPKAGSPPPEGESP